MMNVRQRLTILAALIGILGPGCTAGGSNAVYPARLPSIAPTDNGTLPKSAAVTLRIVIPAVLNPSSTNRRPAYVSSATNSASISQDNGATQTLSLAPGSPNCTTTSGTRTCTLHFNAPPGGHQTFGIKLFASADASGTPLSAQTVVADIVGGAANQFNVVFNGVAASLSVALKDQALPSGQTGSTNVIVNALDASGNTIVGPGVFADANGNPITITIGDSDTSGATHLAQTTVTQSSTIALTYTGAAISNVALTASAPSLTSATATLTISPAAMPTVSPGPTATPGTQPASPAQSPPSVPPPSPNFTPPPLPSTLANARRPAALPANERQKLAQAASAPFFNGATALGNNIYLLNFSNTPFGYYYDAPYPYIYHYDLGYEYVYDANATQPGAIFLYDFASSRFWYTGRDLYPYIYDFTLSTYLYYYPDPVKPNRSTSNPRYFYNFRTGQIITL